MNLAIVLDLSYKEMFEKVISKNNYYIVSINDKKCIILDEKADFSSNLEIVKSLKIKNILEITSTEINDKKVETSKNEGILYSGFLVKGNDMYVKSLIEIAINKSFDKKTTNLTERENEVLALIGCGLSNKEIAKKLFLSEKTVKNHLNNIFKKIEVEDRTNAALYAVRNGIK